MLVLLGKKGVALLHRSEVLGCLYQCILKLRSEESHAIGRSGPCLLIEEGIHCVLARDRGGLGHLIIVQVFQ